MDERLSELLQHQLDLQQNVFGHDPLTMTVEERIAFIHWNHTALTDELHEALGEIGWKPWASSRHVNEEAAVGEMVDAIHFFLNILLALQPHLTPFAIAERFCRRYADKRAVNTRRQEDGYDGVSSKCPACKRELSECGFTRVPEEGSNLDAMQCNGCGSTWSVVVDTFDRVP